MTYLIKSKIKNIRELKNYTQQYMAYQLGITQAGYSKIEKGKTVISYAKLIEICTIFEVSIEELMNFDSQSCIKNLNRVNDNNNCKILKGLYEDKIKLLEKLLNKTEDELEYYKKRFNTIFEMTFADKISHNEALNGEPLHIGNRQSIAGWKDEKTDKP